MAQHDRVLIQGGMSVEDVVWASFGHRRLSRAKSRQGLNGEKKRGQRRHARPRKVNR